MLQLNLIITAHTHSNDIFYPKVLVNITMKIPPLTALRAFEATSRHMSFSKAADEINVTHAAISHQIKNLEEWVGCPLFFRHGRHIELTRIGEMLSKRITPIMEDISDTCTRAQVMAGSSTLNVGCIPSIATRWLVPKLNEFTAENPRSEVKVVYATADEKLKDSNLDILITYGLDDSKKIKATRLFSRINKPVCSPKFLEQHGPFDTAEAIANSPLLHDERRKGWEEWFNAAGISWTADDHWPTYPDFNILATALIAGHGIALCPIEVFRTEINRGDLVILSDISTKSESSYYVMSRENGSDISKKFIEWFCDSVNKGSA